MQHYKNNQPKLKTLRLALLATGLLGGASALAQTSVGPVSYTHLTLPTIYSV